jgi:hypothetical protein
VTETQSVASAEADGVRGRSGAQWALRVLVPMIWVYGGFLVGLLTHAWWSGDDDLVFWPWSLAFLVMLAVWLVLRRRAARVDSPSGRRPAS